MPPGICCATLMSQKNKASDLQYKMTEMVNVFRDLSTNYLRNLVIVYIFFSLTMGVFIKT